MATQWQIGDRIQDRWQIYKILKGGMGTIYIVYDHEAHEAFAAKTFQERFFASQETGDRFIQEAHTWINLDIHQHIVQARLVEVIGGRPFLFLEYVTGGDLSRWIGTPRLTLERALRFALQFCYGMEYALSKGVKAHRDIKPANVLLTEDGTPKITDFGLAKVFDKAEVARGEGQGATGEGRETSSGLAIGLTRTGIGAGTAAYMAPEQFVDVKRVDVRADVYSFGVMLYEMVTAELPFRGRSWQEYEQLHQNQAPPSLRGRLPRGAERVEAIVQRCLRKEAGERYEEFGVLQRELVELYEAVTGESAPMPLVGKALDVMDWSNKGSSLANLGRPDEALVCFDRALAIDPQFAGVWVNKGVALERLGRYDEEIACCDRALTIDPQYKDAWFNKGTALGRLGRYDEALACLDRTLAIDPQGAKAWVNKGNALLGLGRPDEALACLDRALAINPQYGDAWLNKGVALGALGRYDEEIACLDHALAIDPQDKEAWYNKGLALMGLGRYDEEIACYDCALAIDPQYGDAWVNKGVALGALGRYDEEIACCDRALAIDPQYKDAWYNKGTALGRLGRFDESLTCYDRALAIDPRYRDAWYNKGLALWSLGRYDDAFPCFDRVLVIDPQHAMAWYSKGTVLGRLGRYDEALACFDRALTIDPQYKDAWYNKGVALVELGQYDEALPCYDRALAIDPQSAIAWLNKGAVLYNNFRQYREALECFQRAHRLGDPQAAQGIALCLRAMGR